MNRRTIEGPVAELPPADRRRLLDLTRRCVLEYCLGAGADVLAGRDPALAALRRACNELELLPWGPEADRVMSAAFGRFYMRSREGYVSAKEFVATATEADRRYAGEAMCALAHLRAVHGFTDVISGAHEPARLD